MKPVTFPTFVNFVALCHLCHLGHFCHLWHLCHVCHLCHLCHLWSPLSPLFYLIDLFLVSFICYLKTQTNKHYESTRIYTIFGFHISYIYIYICIASFGSIIWAAVGDERKSRCRNKSVKHVEKKVASNLNRGSRWDN